MIKVIFLGTPSFVQPIKDALAQHFTLVNSLSAADLAVVAAYGKILIPEELNAPKYGCINIHPSLLPKYRGPSPIQEAILKGDQISGITIIKMDEQVDHGPIIYQEPLELSDKDNFDTLSKKMFQRASQVLPEIIEDFIQGNIKPVEQNHTLATYCRQLTREDGYFDINPPASPAGGTGGPPSPETLDRMIRAYYPWPGVWTLFRASSAEAATKAGQGSRGQAKIVKFLPGGLVQMAGKKAILLRDFLNGYPDFPLKKL